MQAYVIVRFTNPSETIRLKVPTYQKALNLVNALSSLGSVCSIIEVKIERIMNNEIKR